MMMSWDAAFTRSIRTPTLALGVTVWLRISRILGNSRMMGTAGSERLETPHNNSQSSLECEASACRRFPPAPLTGLRIDTGAVAFEGAVLRHRHARIANS